MSLGDSDSRKNPVLLASTVEILEYAMHSTSFKTPGVLWKLWLLELGSQFKAEKLAFKAENREREIILDCAMHLTISQSLNSLYSKRKKVE